MRHINDNVFQNIDWKFSGITKYSTDNSHSKFDKDPMELVEKDKIAGEVVEKSVEDQRKIMNMSVEKILVAHRNTRLFLFMMSGPFFLLFTGFKSALKLTVLAYIYKKNKKQSP
uniref:Uncharacterized protein n=1 Tax=Strombidium rassoulzadegani TaxID=1082188 RepID=A0A7S3FU63_9SPIT|mmetsp:Transcript_12616/g.21225  ORF Transcript_12616/g.21225 Transcript_12616/m.21225 type:complete len:114 (+) Transcript_12616:466-807(+)